MQKNPKRLHKNVVDAIGYTPMILLNKLPASEQVKCKIYAKCEFLNPGGSIKDRIGRRMVLEAKKQGLIKPGQKVIESTSGNTGIGVALACQQIGHKCVITIPDKMSKEKINQLRALGCEIQICDTDLGHDDPGSYSYEAHRRAEEEDMYYINQYDNKDNWLAHYHSIAPEIYEQLDGKIDFIFICAGTGGTVTGVGKYLKEKNKEIKVIGVDVEGSILARPESMNTGVSVYKVEGVG